jgi:hypothetical protein
VSAGSLKAIKGGKDTEEFESKTITLRGVAYTIREVDLPQYKQALKAAEDAEGAVQFGDLLTQLVLVAVTPSIAARSKPIPFPVYRTLEGIVNEMHFRDLPDEAEDGDDGDSEGEAKAPPNE